MGTQSHSTQSISAPAVLRPTVAEAILVILMGLTAKAALDQIFRSVPTLDGPLAVWEALKADKKRNVLLFAQVAVFFFTMFRFYLGSLRYHQARQQYRRLYPLLFDMLGNTIIFVGFYLGALAIASTQNFYLYIALLHLFDFVWFFGAWLSYKVPANTERILRRFLWYDILTLGLFAVYFWIFDLTYTEPYTFQWVSLATLFLVGVVDFIQNQSFYRGDLPSEP